jgi:hypothetical protein
MAEIFPNESLDALLARFPRATVTTVPTSMFLGLFTGSTAATVPAAATVLAGNPAAVSEPASSGAYARVTIANTDWGAIATSGSGRRTTSAQKSFAESTGSWGTINGFFIADSGTQGAGVAWYYANFDDVTAISVNAAGFTVRITPFWHFDG